MKDHHLDDSAVEPPVERTAIPVIRPAVTSPNPDAAAPSVGEAPIPVEPAGTAPVPTSVLKSDTTKTADDADTDSTSESTPATTPLSKPTRSKTRPWLFGFPARSTAPATAAQPQVPTQPEMLLEQLPTQAMRLVDRLHDSPYQLSAGQRYRRAAEANEIRNILVLALKLGETMFRFGAGSLEVETSIIVVTQTYGIHETEVDITNQAILLNYAPAGSNPVTYHRVVRSWSQNYAGLAKLHRLVTEIAQGEVTQDDAAARLAAIRHEPKTIPPWAILLVGGVFGASFLLFLGGTWWGALYSALTTMVTMSAVNLLARLRIPEVFSAMGGGAVATAVALSLDGLGIYRNPALVVAGSILLLLPTMRIVSAVQDGINGYPMTAAGRLVSSMLAYIGLVAGIVFSVVVFQQLGFPEVDVTRPPAGDYPVWLTAVFVLFAAMSAALSEQTEWKLLVPTGVVSLLGFCASTGVDHLGLGGIMTPALGAVVVGFFGRIVALHLGASQLVVAVPAIMYLLPGLMIFRSMFHVAVETDTLSGGMNGVLQATVVLMAIATGSVLGDTLARPLTGRLQANERRRIGRR